MLITFKKAHEIYPLRSQILRPGQPLELSQYPGDDSPENFHLAAMEKDVIVGIASFYLEPFKEFSAKKPYRLRGMATAPEVRGQGHGRALVESGLEELRARGCDLLWFNARQVAFGFYEKMGFQYHGEMFELPLIGPHKVMYSRL